MKVKNIITLLLISSFTLFNSCDQSNAQLFDLILEIKSQNDQLLNEVKTLQLKSDLLIAELRLSAAKQEELLLKVTELQDQLSTILSQINSLNQQLKAQDADIQLIKNQLADLQTQYQGIFKQLEELQKLSQVLAEIEKMKTQINQLDTRYTTILAGLMQNKQQLDALKTQITSTQTQLADNLTKISQLIGQLGDQGVVISNILKQIELIKNNNAELIKLLENLLLGKSPVPTNGLVLFYPFTGNANDYSGNGRDGIVSGATLTIDRYGKANSAYYFNGIAGTKIQSNYSGILGNESRSISVWVKTKENCCNARHILTWGTASNNNYNLFGGNNYSVFISDSENQPFIGIDNGGSLVGHKTNIIIDDRWHNYIFVYDKTTGASITNVKIFINGLLATNNVSYNPKNINTVEEIKLVIGEYWAAGNDWRTFKGNIDDVAIWNRALTAEEVSKIYLGQGF
jgi:predicted  nucleic acid-binding Zn-ribbon protein